uniref:Predicted protein n=1 Tax=Physcomitrium patens TaxID=3218 RepID=A9U4P8_PHYPA
MDPSITSMFQAFSLSMQQQQSNDRKEALATKALQAVVNKIDQFDGRNISRYLRCYVREMEFNQVSEKKMVELFGLATILEIRDHITSITDHYGNSWEVFSHALKVKYFLEDVDCVTKKLFLEWIERPNKNLQYSQLSKVEKLTLEPNKVDLFLQAADGELQGKLELLIEDKEEDEGLTTKSKNVEDVKADMGMEEIMQRMQDLQIKLARLEENTSKNNSKNVSNQRYIRRCIWCDDTSYTRKDYNEFNNMIRQGIICWKDGKIALKDKEDLLQTNFGKERMRALVQNYLKERKTATRESASYGARVDDDLGGSTKTSEFWAFAISTMKEGKLSREALLNCSYNMRVLKERILNAKMELTLKEVLEIGKKEFHDVIIDSIKQKRQLMGEIGMSHAIDARIYKDKEEVDIGYKQSTNEKNGYNQRNRDRLREKPLPKIVEGFKDFGEEVLSQDKGAFDASFIGILENGNIMYKKVDDFKRKERKRLYNIEGELRKLENGLEDSLELITSIGLGDNDKIVEIHSREVYTILESFQAPKVTVETVDKKVKPVAKRLPEDSKEQMREASKEASLRDPMSIGHQFTKENFEELKIGFDGSLLLKEITCFKKMLAKQSRSFTFESHEIGSYIGKDARSNLDVPVIGSNWSSLPTDSRYWNRMEHFSMPRLTVTE